MTTCVSCRIRPPVYRGARYCRPCYRARKEREQEEAITAAYHAGHRDGRTQAAYTTPPIGTQLLRDLLQLVHPDHHPPERFELANRAAAALLAIREGTTR